METLEQIRDRLLARFPGASVTLVTNPGAAAEHSLLLDCAHVRAIAEFLRDAAGLRFDYCSNVTGIDWLDKEVIDVTKTTVPDPANPAAPPKIVETKTKRLEPGFLEVVYHLYSMELKHGPVVLRLRTGNRSDRVTLPSLTPVWRSCDFQEREVFDLYGVVFDGHPDLRRILMWDEFKDHPMRKDYVAPDDFEWEPTPHGDVLAKAQKHYSPAATVTPAAAVVGRGLPPPPPPAPATRSAVNLTASSPAPNQPGQIDRTASAATANPPPSSAAATPPTPKPGGAA